MACSQRGQACGDLSRSSKAPDKLAMSPFPFPIPVKFARTAATSTWQRPYSSGDRHPPGCPRPSRDDGPAARRRGLDHEPTTRPEGAGSGPVPSTRRPAARYCPSASMPTSPDQPGCGAMTLGRQKRAKGTSLKAIPRYRRGWRVRWFGLRRTVDCPWSQREGLSLRQFIHITQSSE